LEAGGLAVGTVGGKMVTAVNPWARARQWRMLFEGRCTWWGISVRTELAKTCKIKAGALSCSKISQFLHETILEYSEQLYQLCQLQISNRI
jgi:hypothetical protein